MAFRPLQTLLGRLLRALKVSVWQVDDPLPANIYSVSYAGTSCQLVISDSQLYTYPVGGSGSELSFDLREYTIGTLFGPAGFGDKLGYTVTQLTDDYDSLRATLLIETQQDITQEPILSITTNPWWIYYGVLGAQMRHVKDDANEALRQLVPRSLSGVWLDFAGRNLYGILRIGSESDASYVQRIVQTVFGPKSNNVALVKLLLSALNLTNAIVYDDGASLFRVFVTVPPTSSLSLSDVYTLINEWKAAGTDFTTAKAFDSPVYLTAGPTFTFGSPFSTTQNYCNVVNVESGPSLFDQVA